MERMRFYTTPLVTKRRLLESLTQLAGGVTIYETEGFYLNQAGELEQEASAVIEIILDGSSFMERLRIHDLVLSAAREAGEESVLYTTDRIVGELIYVQPQEGAQDA